MIKQYLLLFTCILGGFLTAQTSTSTQHFEGFGLDTDASTISINSADITVNQGMAISQIKIINPYFGWSCGLFYDYKLTKDGVEIVANGCSSVFDNLDVTGFTDLVFIPNDIDANAYYVDIEFDLEITYTTPSCWMPTNIDLAYNGTNFIATWTPGKVKRVGMLNMGLQDLLLVLVHCLQTYLLQQLQFLH